MEKVIYDKIICRVQFLSIELSSRYPVLGKVIYINAPLSNHDYLFFQIQEISLKCEEESIVQNLTIPSNLWVNIKQILIPFVELVGENVIPKVIYSHEEKISSVKKDNIFTVSYKKDFIERGVYLALYNLRRFSYEWKVSTNDDEIFFTLVKNMKRR